MAVLIAIQNAYLRESTSEILRSRDVRVGLAADFSGLRDVVDNVPHALNIAVSSDLEGFQLERNKQYLLQALARGRIKVIMLGETPEFLEGLVIKAPLDVTPAKLASALYTLEFKYADLVPQPEPEEELTVPAGKYPTPKKRVSTEKKNNIHVERVISEEQIAIPRGQSDVIPAFEPPEDSIVGKIGVKQISKEQYAKLAEEQAKKAEEEARKKKAEEEARLKEIREKAREAEKAIKKALKRDDAEPIEIPGLGLPPPDADLEFITSNSFDGSYPQNDDLFNIGKRRATDKQLPASIEFDRRKPESGENVGLKPDKWAGKAKECKNCGAERADPSIRFCPICGSSYPDRLEKK